MTAVPPRPAAVVAMYADCIDRGCGSVAGCYPEPCRLDHPAAPDATAGDGLRDQIGLCLESHTQFVNGLPLRILTCDLGILADAVLALPALRDVLAAAARDAEKVRRVEELAEEMKEAANLPPTHGEFDRGVAAHQRDAAERLHRALDGTP